MMLPKIDIKCPGVNRAEIFVDGHRLSGVRNISLHMPIDEIPYVQVEIITDDLVFDGEAALDVKVVDVLAEETFLDNIVDRVVRTIKKRIGTYS